MRLAPQFVTLLFSLVFLCLAAPGISAQQHKIKLDELINDSQKFSPDISRVSFAWWLSEEFWDESLKLESKISEHDRIEFLKFVKPYHVFVVADGRIAATGTVTYRPEPELRKLIQLVDIAGNIYTPIPDTGMPIAVKTVLSVMKPIFSNALGQLGQNFNFYVFPALDKQGKPFIEAKKEGKFVLKMGDDTFQWKLPLPSLVPAKVCPVDGEELNGAWKFCPWHGERLKAKP